MRAGGRDRPPGPRLDASADAPAPQADRPPLSEIDEADVLFAKIDGADVLSAKIDGADALSAKIDGADALSAKVDGADACDA